MAKLLAIQEHDKERLEMLMRYFKFRKQIDVIRAGLEMLEQEAQRLQKIERWKKAAMAVSESSHAVNKEFQKHSSSRLKRI